MKQQSGADWAASITPEDLKREAALNLSLIYRSSGAEYLAIELLQEYVCI